MQKVNELKVEDGNCNAERSANTRGRIKAVAVVAGTLTTLAVAKFVSPSQTRLSTCPFNMATGLDCPLCGGTRALHALTNGDIVSAIDYNALAALLVIPALAVFLGWITVTLWKRNEWSVPRSSWLLLGILGAFWVVRNLPFSWAEPLRA